MQIRVRKERGRFLLAGLAAFLNVIVAGYGHGEVDPSLVGAWAAEHQSAVARSRLIWEFRDDGTYTYDAHDGHSGTYDTTGGQLRLNALNRAWPHITPHVLHLVYSVVGPDRLQLSGLAAPTDWTRVTREVYFNTRKVGSQYVPENLPAVVARTVLTAARPWRQDAIPVSLRVKYLESGMFGLQLYFVSPADSTGLRVDIHKFKQDVSAPGRVNWGRHAIPVDFLDLPEVLRIAGRRGAGGSLKEAGLRRWERGHRAWVLNVGGKGFALDAVTGQPIREEMSNYTASYNTQWAKAAEGIRRLFRKENPEDKVSCTAIGAWWQHDKCYYERKEEILQEAEADCRRRGGSWRWASCY